MPVDAQLERDTDVRFEAVTLDDVLAATAGAGLRVVILDACRNNPLAWSMQRTVASRSVIGTAMVTSVGQDFGAAVAWFRRAAEQGQPGAQHNLGLMCRDGRGAPQDYDTALMWFRRAAEQGSPFAQTSLGYAYQQGQGVPPDRSEAVRWYRLAAPSG